MLKENDLKIFVAVKTAQTDDRTSRLKILQKESEIMRGISHKNVVQMKVFCVYSTFIRILQVKSRFQKSSEN